MANETLFFNEVLRQYRQWAGLTQEQLAEGIGYGRQRIAQWESKENPANPPKAFVVLEIADVLKLRGEDTNRLLRRAGYAEKPLRDRKKNSLNQLPAYRRWSVPPLPIGHLERPEVVREIKELLLADIVRPLAVVGLQGMGGIGKTVTAAELAHTKFVETRFPDGVIWLTVGREPDILKNQQELASALGVEKPYFISEADAKMKLKELVAGKRCLIILDDVWELQQLSPLNIVDELSTTRVLMTTRKRGLVQGEYQIGLLTEDESIRLLALTTDSDVGKLKLSSDVAAIVEMCGRLPLALGMIGAMVETRGTDGWVYARKRLEQQKLERIKAAFPDYLYPNLWTAIDVSVQDLVESELADFSPIERYLDLAIFPEDSVMPFVALQKLWSDVGMDEIDVEDMVALFVQRAIVQRDDDGEIRLHDLQHDYVQTRTRSDFDERHKRLINAYRIAYPHGWETGVDDGYYYQSLLFHLSGAGVQEEIETILLEYDWYEAKLEATNITALRQDFDWRENKDRFSTRGLIQDALRLSTPVLGQDKRQLGSQLMGRLSPKKDTTFSSLHEVIQVREQRSLLPITSSLTQPGGLLCYSFLGHTDKVGTLLLHPDGRRVLTACDSGGDTSVKVWNIESGEVLHTLSGHSSNVDTILLHPDRQRVLTACSGGGLRTSGDANVTVWDIDSGKVVHTLTGHTSGVSKVLLHPDRRRVLTACSNFSGSSDTSVKVWDIDSGEVINTLGGHTETVGILLLHPDGRRLLTACGTEWTFGSSDPSVKVWDIDSGEIVHTLNGHTAEVSKVLLHPDGRRVLTACSNFSSSDTSVKVWDIETGEVVHTLNDHAAGVSKVLLHPDGRRVLIACSNFSSSSDTSVKIWDIETGEAVHTLNGHTASHLEMWLHPDGRRVLTACSNSGSSDTSVKVWNIDNGEVMHTLTGHVDGVRKVWFHPDGRRVLTTCGSGKDTSVKVWDIESGEVLHSLSRHILGVTNVLLHPDGRRVLTASGRSVNIWDIDSGEAMHTLTGHTESVRIVLLHPDGRHVLTTCEGRDQRFSTVGRDTSVKVWDIDSGGEAQRLPGRHSDSVRTLLLHPDGKRVLTAFIGNCGFGSRDTSVKVWDIDSGEAMHALSSHTERVTKVLLHPDGRRMLTACGCCVKDTSVKVRDIDNGKVLYTFSGHTGTIGTILLHPDGQRVLTACNNFSGSRDTNVKVWDIDSGEVLHTLTDYMDNNGTILLHPDGRRVLTVSGTSVKVWDIDSGEVLYTFSGHTGTVGTILLHPDGRRVLTTCGTSVKVWNIDNGKVLHTVSGHTSTIGTTLLHPDEQRVLTTCGTSVKVWNIDSGEVLHILIGHQDTIGMILLHPDGRRVLTACGTEWSFSSNDASVKVWDIDSGETLHTLSGHANSVRAALLHPDGQRVLTSCSDGNIRTSSDTSIKVWDIDSGEVLHTLFESASYFGLCKQDMFAYGANDQQLSVWNLLTGDLLYRYTADSRIESLVAVDDARFVLGDAGGQVHFLRISG
ncbi:MAG: NB-ARC domain-containing protein [Chloroflexota bacterium]